MIQFKALGGVVLTGPDGPADRLVGRPRRLALLSWLVLAIPRGPQRRDRILALFWPEVDEAHARNSLSQSIYHLRRELEPGLIVSRGAETLGIDYAHLDCDVLAFEQAVAAGRLPEARALYRGELLPAFHVSGAPDFERWLERERQRLAGLAVDAGWGAATAAERAGDAAAAAVAARWAAGLVPYDEEALRRLLALLARAGDHAGVVDAYESFAGRLSREFGERPSAETVALVAEVRASGPRTEAAVAPMPVADPPVGEPLPDPAPFRTSRTRLPLLAAAGVLLLAFALVFLSRRTARAAPTSGGRTLAIMPFTTHGDPSLAYVGDGLQALLEAKLDGVGRLRLADPATVRALLPRAATSAETAAVSVAARRLRATHFVTADVTVVADRVEVRAELHELGASTAQLVAVSASGARDSLFALADTLAVRLLAQVSGLGPRALQAAGAAGTGSLEAFRSYIDGEAAMAAGRYAEAAERFRSAVTTDSGFAIAAYRGAMALDWASRGSAEIQPMLALAERGRARLSERQRRLLAAAVAYYHQDGDSAERVLRGVVADDPDAIEAWFLLGETLFHLGAARGHDWRASRTAFERVRAIDPDDPETLLHLARLAAADGDLPGLDSLTSVVMPRLGGTVRGWELEVLQAWAHGEPARMASVRKSLASAPPGAAQEAARALAVYLEDVAGAADLDAAGPEGASASRHLQYAAARGRWREAIAADEREPCGQGYRSLCAAMRLATVTLPGVPLSAERERALRAALGPVETGEPTYAGAMRELMLGRLAAARGDRAAWSDARARLVTMTRSEPLWSAYPDWLDAAWLARQGGDVHLADGMRAALADPALRHGLLGVDVASPARLDAAMALEAAGHDDEARVLYRSMPDPSGRDLTFLPYARLGEARIHARRGERDAARRLYGQVLHLWRDADRDFQPTVAAARADSARLGR